MNTGESLQLASFKTKKVAMNQEMKGASGSWEK